MRVSAPSKSQLKTISSGLGGNMTASYVIWIASVGTTSIFLGQLGVSGPMLYILSLVIQYFMSKIEQPLWRGEARPVISIVITIIDILINSMGVWKPIKLYFHQTDLWNMIADWTRVADRTPPFSLLIAISVLIGIFVAAAPEYFRMRAEKEEYAKMMYQTQPLIP